MKARNGGEEIYIRRLFHGTGSADAVHGICINNFDFRVSGKHGTAFGDGAYFARDSRYSDCYAGSGSKRYIFLALVLVGEYTLGHTSYRRPPSKPGKPDELYDSCVDNVADPAIFVVFEKNQVYPEYLIEYRVSYQGEDIYFPTRLFMYICSRPYVCTFEMQQVAASTLVDRFNSTITHDRPQCVILQDVNLFPFESVLAGV